MNTIHITKIATAMKLSHGQVKTVAGLFFEGGTIPFVARYRKEATGSLDEVALTTIRDRLKQLGDLDKRRDAIVKSLDERELLSEALKNKIAAADTMAVLEDIYLPYRPKRRTRATLARAKGLEPLALMILAQEISDLNRAAAEFVNTEKGVADITEALQGARDIIAEMVSEDAHGRGAVRSLFLEEGDCIARVLKGKEEEGAKFKDYFDWRESVKKAPSHRLLAMFRGEKEGILSLSIIPEKENAVTLLSERFVKTEN
ncbi:MAG: RNA-binding transcriptional accessory protein, partial [Candidatus Hydrogenedentes bacterium]|nr:RNA-binding transcriptional accessory protein [Candidatus Hydrogenedentota bacterium]